MIRSSGGNERKLVLLGGILAVTLGTAESSKQLKVVTDPTEWPLPGLDILYVK